MAEPLWAWCPVAGAIMTGGLVVEESAYGDGFVHRRTRGINPSLTTWQLAFPFRDAAELKTMDDFLMANAVAGFWFKPPTGAAAIFMTCDEWSSSVQDRTPGGDMLGQLQATFARSFTPQPGGA